MGGPAKGRERSAGLGSAIGSGEPPRIDSFNFEGVLTHIHTYATQRMVVTKGEVQMCQGRRQILGLWKNDTSLRFRFGPFELLGRSVRLVQISASNHNVADSRIRGAACQEVERPKRFRFWRGWTIPRAS